MKVILLLSIIYRGIAQLVEQRSPKPRAEGSNPSAPAKKKRSKTLFQGIYCVFSFCPDFRTVFPGYLLSAPEWFW